MIKQAFFLILIISSAAFSQKTSAEIYHDLQKVHSLKRVLYIAAHPDDENTRALAYLSNGELAETAYLSLTRGDGGQNLIGDELSEDLGVLRTQELLAARSIDGARQFFTRAVDFGYSKSAEESFEKWGKEAVLSDVVRVIRAFKPDIILTRFPPDSRGGHGHHTASAMLAIEAFSKAADETYEPNQVKEFGTWQTTSLYWNSSSWWDNELADKAKNNPDYFVQDIGGFNALLGKSYNEIGTLARSQHKCQGFGAIVERGSLIEYFQHYEGKKLKSSFFENNTTTWKDLVSIEFDNKFNALLTNFDFVQVENNVAPLIELRKTLNAFEDSRYELLRKDKIAAIDQLIIACLGLHIDITANDYGFAIGDTIAIDFNFLNRSSIPVQINGIKNREILLLLEANQPVNRSITFVNQANISTPFWLEKPFNTMFDIATNQIGNAENEATFNENIQLSVAGESLEINFPIIYKWRDPSYGERQRPVISSPNFTANFDQTSIILKPGNEKILNLKIHSFAQILDDEIKIVAPKGWEITPTLIPLKSTKKHEEIWTEIKVKPAANSSRGELKLINKSGDIIYSFTEIAYDHIPTQVIFKPAVLQCIPVRAEIKPGKVAYIKGAGDAVPQAIEQLGFEIDQFEVADLATLDLTHYQSVVLGIRIYNVSPELHNFDEKLFTYVKNGGNVVMQYNTASRRPTGEKFGPLPFELSRNRVTEENAKVEFLAPEHPLLNVPNKIVEADFDNWVQERGLYFASDYEADYTPILSWHDQGESAQNGGLIVANYGKGRFIYTGISFFRELPNGVTGAYRLFANLLSY